ncbi:hypothetical protein [Haloarcula sp. H-GB5]
MPNDYLLDRIDSLRDDVEDNQVDELLEILVKICAEAVTTNETVDEIADRLTYVEDTVGVGTDGSVEDLTTPNFDHRDVAVLQVIQAWNPEQVSITKIQEIYTRQTDMQEKTMIRNRTKELVDRGPFENVDGTTWQFTAHQPDGRVELDEA